MNDKEHPPSHQAPHPQPQSDHNALNLPERKGTGKKVWLVIITAIVVASLCIGGTWYYMNKKQQNQKYELQAQIDQLGQQLKDLKKSSLTSDTENTQGYTTKSEKISFVYPTIFKLTDTSRLGSDAGGVADIITLTNGQFSGLIKTGVTGVGGECPACKVILSEPIKILGQSRYLNYVSSDGGPKVDYIIVSSTPQVTFGGIEGKNITSSSMIFKAEYLNGDKDIAKSVADLQSDPNIAAFKQVLSSMKY